MRVLGGRGAVEEEEEDLPELSDSGDEAAWEDEDDADPSHEKQQTPCLFCDRFVHHSARLQLQRVRATWVCVVCSSGVQPESNPRNLEPHWFRGRSHELEARFHDFSCIGLSFPLCKMKAFPGLSMVLKSGCAPLSSETLKKIQMPTLHLRPSKSGIGSRHLFL